MKSQSYSDGSSSRTGTRYTDWLESYLRNERGAAEMPEDLHQIASSKIFKELTNGSDNIPDEDLTIEDIKLFLGIYSAEEAQMNEGIYPIKATN